MTHVRVGRGVVRGSAWGKISRKGVTAALLALLAACHHDKADPCRGDPSGPGCAGAIVSVVIGTIPDLIGPNQTKSAKLTALGKNGQAVPIGSVIASSTKPLVAAVTATRDSVTVTSLGRGQAQVSIVVLSTTGATQATGTLTVNVIDVSSVQLTPKAFAIAPGESRQLTSVVTADAGVPQSLNWTSSNANVATVSGSGVVTGVSLGSATIVARSTVNAAIGDSATVQVSSSVASISLSILGSCVSIGRTVRYSVEARDGNGVIVTGRSAAVTVTPSNLATVSPTEITGAVAGDATVTARLDNASDAKALAVRPEVVRVLVSAPNASLRIGESTQAQVNVSDCASQPVLGKPVSWRSSNTNVVTVSSTGLISAVAPGNATITATVAGVDGNLAVGVASAQPSQLVPLSNPAPTGIVNTQLAESPRVRAIDALGRGVPNAAILFSVVSGGGTVGSATVLTDSVSAEATTPWTLGAVEGAQDLRISVPAVPGVAPVNIRATALNPPASFIAEDPSLLNQSGTIFAPAPAAPSVRLLKANQAPLAGALVTFSASSGAIVPLTPVTTDASGFARLTSWTLGSGLGDQTVTASTPALSGTTVVFHVNAGAPTLSPTYVSGIGRTNSPYQIRVNVKDRRGINMVGAPVVFTFGASPGGGTLNPVNTSTNSSGDASAIWNIGATLGTYTGTAQVGEAPPLALSVDAQLPSFDRGIVKGTVVQLDRNGNATPVAGEPVTIRIGNTFYSLTQPSNALGAFQTGDLESGNYTFVLQTKFGKIREIRYGVTPSLGSIVSIGPLRFTPGATSGPVEFQLNGSTAIPTDAATVVRVFEGSGGTGLEAGRPELSVFRDSGDPTLWNASMLEGFYRVRITTPLSPTPLFGDCEFHVELPAATAPRCTINVP